MVACSAHKNTAKSRFWQSFTAKYNTYYNGSLAYTDGALEKEKGHKDNFTEMLPLNTVSSKQSRTLGKGNFDRTIEKMEKTIKLHSIKTKPEWNKSRRKTPRDKEWLGRKEYNPFLWKAWLMMGQAQYQKGEFDEAAATFSYMARLYQTQPLQNGIARAWLARCYVELDWLYDAEDVIRNMSRDSMHYQAKKDWDATYADYYLKAGEFEKALPYLRQTIRHEKRKTQKAREWFIMGQVQSTLGKQEKAYKAYQKAIRQNPPYELEFNARIAQTEVMAKGNYKKMIARLNRMARSDNNKDYLDQVYYAIGNIYMMQRDTTKAIAAYEKGNEKATRGGIEKGVLLLKLGDLYWTKEKYNDAQRCYGEAIGLLDKERPDYEELSKRSKVLDELVPFTDAVHLQDSLQELANMDEKDRLAAIDRVIEALKKKEKEERKKAQEAEVEKALSKQGATGNRNQPNRPNAAANAMSNGQWYFYNQMAVSQGKQTFQKQWGKRENTDDWQRVNKTVVNLNLEEPTENLDSLENLDNLDNLEKTETDSLSTKPDSLANDPHNREYYLAQIPFSDEQKAESNLIIMDGLYNSGVIFKDKLENLTLAEKQLTRLTSLYPDYEKMDQAWYHLYLLYSRKGDTMAANDCLKRLIEGFPESEWAILLNDPYFEENARFGEHIEDSLYGATYDAFKENNHSMIHANAKLSAERFPLGENRPKFIFINGLSLLNEGDSKGCVAELKTVVEKYPQSEVTEMAGMIIKGVQEGKTLYGGKFDLDDIWSRRDVTLDLDSTSTDTLSANRNVPFLFMLVYQPDSVNENQLLYEMARFNFSNFLVRNFDLEIEREQGFCRMLIRGFQSFDEALQYTRQLYASSMQQSLRHCRSIVISEHNLKLIGSRYSYKDYDEFYEHVFLPIPISNEELLNIPTYIGKENDGEETDDATQSTEPEDDDDFDLW
jgi:tetratricopeptide (TPR) repeat protein